MFGSGRLYLGAGWAVDPTAVNFWDVMASAAISVIARVFTIRVLRRLGLAREEGVNGSGELVAAMKELELENEDELEQVTAQLLNHLTASKSGATCMS